MSNNLVRNITLSIGLALGVGVFSIVAVAATDPEISGRAAILESKAFVAASTAAPDDAFQPDAAFAVAEQADEAASSAASQEETNDGASLGSVASAQSKDATAEDDASLGSSASAQLAGAIATAELATASAASDLGNAFSAAIPAAACQSD